MYKVNCIAVFIFLLYSAASAQQLGQLSNFDQNIYAFNPAYGGMDFELRFNGTYRSQWTALEGQPISYDFNAQLPLYAAYGGAGIHVESETLGPRSMTRYSVSYNYVLSTGLGIISIGLRPSFYQWTWDGSQLITPGGNYEGTSIEHLDPALVESSISTQSFNVGAGVHFQNEQMKVGIFTRQLLQAQIGILDDFGYNTQLEAGAYVVYQYDWSNRITLQPSGMMMTDGNRWQAAVKFGTLIDDAYYVNLGWRGFTQNSLDALILGGGIKLSDQFWAYYNHDVGLSGLRNAHNGTHEIMLVYRLNRKLGGVLPPRVIYNPRYVE
jgi:type IX secretion system PorP/SprF family membrane protein